MKENNFFKLLIMSRISYRRMIGLGAVVIAASMIKVFLAYIYQHVINNLQFFLSKDILMIFFVVFGIIILAGVLLKVYENQKRLISQEATYNLQKNLLNKKINSSLNYSEKEQTGEWLTRISSDCKILANFYPVTVLGAIKGFVPFLLGLVYGFFVSYKLTIVIILCSFCATFIPKMFIKKIEETQEEKQISDEGVRSHVIECIDKATLIKSYNAIDFFVKKFEIQYDNYSNSSVENAKLNAKIESVNVGIGFMMNTIWMIVGVFMIMNDTLEVGSFVGFMVLSDCFNWPFFELPSLINDFVKAKVSFNRLNEMKYDDKSESMREDVIVAYSSGYNLKNVSFSYDSKKESVINDLNIEINEKFVAIVGESGSGKTTLLKLLSGLYSPSAGFITLKIGENVWSGREISEHVCYVSQNNQVFTDSILENIRYGNVSASDDEVVEAAKLANVDEFVRTLPQGYNTIIGENSDVQLSTGQLQRIALARGMIRNAEVYLLDEVTSALDALNQQTIISNLQLLNKKIIFVTHNIDLIEAAERVIKVC